MSAPGGVWFTSDTHYHHANIIKYCARPFADVADMHHEMIRNWNSAVGPLDTVYHLGDFAFGPVSQIKTIRARLQGRIVLIRGNHDRAAAQMLEAGFDAVHDRLEIALDGYKLYLAHVPVGVSAPDRKYKKEFTHDPPTHYDYFLCGHVHEKWLRRGKVINVGVDQWGFTPRTLAEILAAPEAHAASK